MAGSSPRKLESLSGQQQGGRPHETESDSFLRYLDSVTAGPEKSLQKASSPGFNGTPAHSSSIDQGGGHGFAYGSVGALKVTGGSSVAAVAGRVYSFWQQVFAVVVGLCVLVSVGQHALDVRRGAGEAVGLAPAPAPLPGASASGEARPGCKAYKYPQCEGALNWYLSLGARNRCEAFERVRAEGDIIRFPYSATKQDHCDTNEAGCCGCPGQCSKCPPILTECNSWQLDGSWKVAFADGSRAAYTFDAHGHCEVELPASALPRLWTPFTATYIATGNDLPGTPQRLSVPEAETLCEKTPNCRGITYDAGIAYNEKHRGSTYSPVKQYDVFLKSVSALSPAPGTSWHALVDDRPVQLDAGAAIAGILLYELHSRTQLLNQLPDAYTFDLHRAAPQLFPENSNDFITLENGELVVRRTVRGVSVMNGTGIAVRPS